MLVFNWLDHFCQHMYGLSSSSLLWTEGPYGDGALLPLAHFILPVDSSVRVLFLAFMTALVPLTLTKIEEHISTFVEL